MNPIEYARLHNSTATTVRGAAKALRGTSCHEREMKRLRAARNAPKGVDLLANAKLEQRIRTATVGGKLELVSYTHTKFGVGADDLPSGGRWAIATLADAELSAIVDEKARERFSRRSNWNSVVPVTHTFGGEAWDVQNVDMGRYSSRCTYTHWSYTPVYQSAICCTRHCALVVQGGVLVAKHVVVGVRSFGVDDLGVYIEKGGIRYHPTAAEWRLPKAAFSKACTAGLALAQKAQREGELIAKAKQSRLKELKKVGITLADSQRAGNCYVGTMRYAEQIGVPREYALAGYPVPAKSMDFSNPRVLAAAEQAYRRETLVAI